MPVLFGFFFFLQYKHTEAPFVAAHTSEINLTTKGILQMNHIEMALLKNELQRLQADYQKCEDERLKEYIREDIKLIENAINMRVSEAKSKV